ncbi:hypothetical protein Ciccas_011033 [Cichlidogyrus casuarinus]|uniref:Uncharacterized protein n=1 Tax=Cichlidogyrus casuarinus TaxID=1844966 RepID=A0ABD2PT29_9PLAT
MRQLFAVAIMSLLLIRAESQNLRPFCLPRNITDVANSCFNQCKSKHCARGFNVISNLVNCYDSQLKFALAFVPSLTADQKQTINNFLTYDIGNLKTMATNALATMPTQSDIFFQNLVTTSPNSLSAILDMLDYMGLDPLLMRHIHATVF